MWDTFTFIRSHAVAVFVQIVHGVCSQDSVYVKFVSESAASQAYKLLHGWMYDGTNCLSHFLLFLFKHPLVSMLS